MFDDITYFDGEYYEGKYHTVIKQSSVELLGDYFEEGYITDDYFQENDGGVFSLTADPTSIADRWADTNRPINWSFVKGNGAVTDYSFSTSNKKFGSHSLLLPGESGYHYVVSDPIFKTAVLPSDTDDFSIEFWFYFTDDDADIAPLFSFGSSAWLTNDANISGSSTDIFIYARNNRLEATVRVWPNYPSSDSVETLADATSTAFTDNSWTKAALTYTASTKTYALYINTGTTNQLVDSRAISATYDANQFRTDGEMYLYEGNFDTETKYYDNIHMRYGANGLHGASEYPGSEEDLVYTKFNNNFDDDTTLEIFGNASLSSSATITADATVSITGASSMSSVTSLTASANVTKLSSSSLSSAASLSSDVNRIQTGASNLTCSATMSATAVKTVTVSSSPSGAATLSIDYNRTRNFDTDFDVIGSTIIAAGKVGDFFVDADIIASLTVDGFVIVNGAASLSSAFNTQTDATRTRSTSTSISASATIAETSTRLRRASSSLAAATSVSIDTRTIRDTSVAMSAAHSLSTIIGKTTGSVVDLESAFDISMLGGSLTPSSASINATFTQITTGFIINLAQYVYYIPVESRLNTISSETRSHSVRPETRAHSVNIETRSQTIRTEDRIHEVKGT